MLRISPVIALVLLAGCSNPQGEARAKLRNVDLHQLRLEAVRMYMKLYASPGPEFVSLKPEQWPPTFKKLEPVRIGCYRDGFAFVFAGSAGRESGLHIQPLGMDKMPSAAVTRYERIEEGVFWFQGKK